MGFIQAFNWVVFGFYINFSLAVFTTAFSFLCHYSLFIGMGCKTWRLAFKRLLMHSVDIPYSSSSPNKYFPWKGTFFRVANGLGSTGSPLTLAFFDNQNFHTKTKIILKLLKKAGSTGSPTRQCTVEFR